MLPGNCLHGILEARVREAPHRVAVTAGDTHLTYGELDARATEVARRLRGLGVGAETLVGLACPRDASLVVGMVAILKAGGAYLPIDPAYPDERVRLLLDDSRLTLAVATGAAADQLAAAGVKVVRPDDRSAPDGTDQPGELPRGAGGDLAYVIYTSGSTGTPKGVAVEHRHVVRLFTSTAVWFGFDHRDVWSMCHSASFDFSVWEVWGALLHGGRLVVVPIEATRQPAGLWRLLRQERVTVLSQTPSAFRQLAAADDGAGELDLRLVIFGGERLPVAALRPWLDRYGDQRPRLINMYGITETTVHATYRRIRYADLAEPQHSPIGVAVPDLRVTLHDESGEPVPNGTPGEIWVSGAGVARGYLHRPELTAQRFTTGPDGVRCYRSGDLAVRTARGDLHYLGRVDDQLQVRGYRIEPYEVESCLCRHPAVAAAVVTAHEYPDGDTRLVAYVQPQPGADGDEAGLVAALTDHAAGHLPAHLRPSHYRLLPWLPLTPQGKVDRAALRHPADPAGRTAGAGGPAPAAAAVAQIAAAVLERDRVPPDEDLFDLGATSLMYARIVAEVNERLHVSLTGGEVEVASVSALATAATAMSRAGTTTTERGSSWTS